MSVLTTRGEVLTWEEFLDYCGDSNPIDESSMAFDHMLLTELIETGSVTVTIDGESFVLSIGVIRP